MQIKTIFFLFLIFILSLLMIKRFVTPHSQTKALPSDVKILAFGDSLTYGYGAEYNESYPDYLSQRIHRSVINEGIPGELSAEGAKRLPVVLDKYNPAILILCHGGNDILQKKEEAALRQNLEEMIQLAQKRQIEIILIAVPQFGLLYLTPHPLYEELAERYQLPIESQILSNLLHDNRYKSDYIHPNAAGYEKMAEAIAKLLHEHYEF